MTAILELRRNALAAIVPPPRMDLSTWIESNMRLPAVASALPGPVRLYAHQRGIADAISDPAMERVTVQKSARIGYSTLLTGALCHYVANDPAPVLCVLPTEADCRSYMVDSIEPIFEASPAVRTLLADDAGEGGRNTLLQKRFPGGSLAIVAARAPRNLRARTAKILIVDEADGMETTAEGSPVKLAEMRTQTFADRKIIIGSTPTLEATSHVIRAYAESDRRVFEVPCPACGSLVEIMWRHIEWPDGRPQDAAFRCPECEELVEERHKAEMVAAGAWRATAPDVEGHAGFRINSLVSTLPNASWGKLAAEFIVAKKSPDDLMAFINTVLGEGWREAGDELDESALRARAEPFGLDSVPPEVLLVTAGVDVQRDRLEVTFLGWSRDEILILGHAVIWGSPSENETWCELDDALKATWSHPNGGTLRVDAAAIDSGDGETTDAVMAFCKPRFGRRVVAIKGAAGNRPAIEASKSKGGKLFIVGVDGVKSQLLSRLARGRSVRFSASLSPDWFEQLASERRVTRYQRGQPIRQFVRLAGRRAEALDTVVYGMAVRQLVAADMDRRAAELATTAALPLSRPAVIRSSWMLRT